VVLIGFLGLAIDLGHLYNNKGQLQNMADACALSGATALNGTAAGIQLATDRARDLNGNLDNKTEFNNQSVTLAETAVSFSDTLNGTYVDKTTAQGNAANIKFVRVVIPPQQSDIVFAKIIPGIPTSLSFGAEAVAGQLPQTKVCNSLDPFSPTVRDPSDPINFGYTPGYFYELRLSPGASGKNCGEQGIPGSVTGNFQLADPNGCGPSTPCFRDAVINGSNGKCIDPGPSLPTTTGSLGINVEKALQDRFDQDDYLTAGSYNQYAGTRYRRFLRVAFNDGNIPPGGSGNFTVSGFGCFYMATRPLVNPPSSAICLQYAGSCDEAGRPTGNSGKASLTQIVLYR
jgi:Flp pilus assembly protein TadG